MARSLKHSWAIGALLSGAFLSSAVMAAPASGACSGNPAPNINRLKQTCHGSVRGMEGHWHSSCLEDLTEKRSCIPADACHGKKCIVKALTQQQSMCQSSNELDEPHSG